MPIRANADEPEDEEDFPGRRVAKTRAGHPSKKLTGFKPSADGHPPEACAYRLKASARRSEMPVAKLDEGARWLVTGGGGLEAPVGRLETPLVSPAAAVKPTNPCDLQKMLKV